MNTAIGIDLGTTYSCVGIYNTKNKKVEIISNEFNEKIIPSYISLSDTNEILIGSEAKKSKNLKTIYDIKRLIGKNYLDCDLNYLSYYSSIINNSQNQKLYVNFNNKEMTPEELSTLILIYLKEMAEKYLGYKITDAVITVPAYFNDSQRQATKFAGIQAGLNILRIINEPTAAALAYGIDKLSNEKRIIIVIDIGGGTTDISLLSLEEGVFEVISTSGDTNLGGEDIDNLLVSYFAELFGLNLLDKNILKDLKIKTELLKKQLSISEEVEFEIEPSKSFFITRNFFNTLCNDIFNKFLKPLNLINISKYNVDDIILVGGTTRIPKIRELISDYFNNKKLYYEINPDEAVATGAAIQAAILAGINDENLEEIILLDIIPLSLGIETDGGLMTVIIPKDSSVPIKKTQIFSTAYDNQTYVKIKIFEGESIIAENNHKLGEFIISDIPQNSKGVPKIEVSYYVNINGILEVSAIEKSSGKNNVKIINNLTLNSNEVLNIIEKTEKNKNEDVIYKHQIEMKNKLISLCNAITNNRDKYKSEIVIKASTILNELNELQICKTDTIYNELIEMLSNLK